jgi:hypothetical protein
MPVSACRLRPQAVYHKRLFATQYTWCLVNTGGTRKVVCLITDFRTAGRGKFKFGGQVRETYTTARRSPDRTQIICGRPLWRAMLLSDSSFCMWATDGGRTQIPGFLVHLVLFVLVDSWDVKMKYSARETDPVSHAGAAAASKRQQRGCSNCCPA